MTTSQYFVYKRPIAWTLLIFTCLWGTYAYMAMPQRQDPQIQIRSGVVLTTYPGAGAVEVEQEVSRKVEKKLAENPAVEHVRSISRQNLSVVFVDLYDTTRNAEAIWQDLDNKLAAMTDLPQVGGQPLRPRLDKDFGDTVAVMLTISSPPISDQDIEQRADVISRRLVKERAERPEALRSRRYSGVLVHPSTVDRALVERLGRLLLQHLTEAGLAEDGRYVGLLGAGVVDFRLPEGRDEAKLLAKTEQWSQENIGSGLGHPDIWPGVIVQDPNTLARVLKTRCQAEPGGIARYSYEELHKFADLIQDRLRQSPKVGKIEQLGVIDEAIYLYFSNRRLAPFGLDPTSLGMRLAQRNINQPGGTVELPRQSLVVKPSGKFQGEAEMGNIVVDTRDGVPLYLKDLVEVVRGYEDPPRVLNFRSRKFAAGQAPTVLQAGLAPTDQASHEAKETGHAEAKSAKEVWTTRAVTLAVRQVKGTQIADFDRDLNTTLASLKGALPEDLTVERTSDEPERVARKIDQFKDCLLEAVLIVVAVALVFMEWRSALLVAISIPITLAMTLGFCHMLGVDMQQVSIAALIIALGLLVDDPVVAGDAINREMAHGVRRDVAAWLGPQKLSRAILYATITNCVAFLPLLLVSGAVGEFIWSLPVVVTSSLVASRIVSMTFIPLLGYYMLRGQHGFEAGLADGGKGSRFARIYNGFSEFCMDHKWASLAACLVVMGAAFSLLPLLGTNFFPKDLHTAFTVNLFLPEGTSIRETKGEAMRAIEQIEALVGDDVEAYTTFVGAGGPRFWLSIVPEQPSSNYAQVMVHTRDVYQTEVLADRLKRELPPRLSVARVHVQQLESGPPIGIPVQVRVQGPDLATARRLGEQIKGYMREFPGTENIQDDWDPEYLQIGIRVDSDRANVAGVSHQDVAAVTSSGLTGLVTTYLRERDRLIPVMLRLRPDERGRMEDMKTMNIFGSGGGRVPLNQIAAFQTERVAPKISRRDHERCLTVKCDVVRGVLASKVVEDLDVKLREASKSWPAGYHYAFGGEKEEQEKGFGSMSVAMIASVLAIYLALVLQFNSLTKPLVVFAAVPFGMVGGLMGLILFNVPLGFFALLGLSSLAGVIISHVIVLFEYIEEAHERGETLHRAVIDAALVRLRPVLVTVLATVGGLIPLVYKGGPLWEPLCYVQIMGLLVATLVTKVVVPVLYVLFVEDFKLIKWSKPGEHTEEGPPAEYVSHGHGVVTHPPHIRPSAEPALG
ncbi:efflux RND transporter permease subunit [Singulisphaera sp. PoT]|uniref:efflux RND transporter permease subunit n=1 Tax=Singulisphaera sp. PoT TaxID=3411797 RepID=UPI003BF4CCD9